MTQTSKKESLFWAIVAPILFYGAIILILIGIFK